MRRKIKNLIKEMKSFQKWIGSVGVCVCVSDVIYSSKSWTKIIDKSEEGVWYYGACYDDLWFGNNKTEPFLVIGSSNPPTSLCSTYKPYIYNK